LKPAATVTVPLLTPLAPWLRGRTNIRAGYIALEITATGALTIAIILVVGIRIWIIDIAHSRLNVLEQWVKLILIHVIPVSVPIVWPGGNAWVLVLVLEWGKHIDLTPASRLSLA
jgi:hypothetical protein